METFYRERMSLKVRELLRHNVCRRVKDNRALTSVCYAITVVIKGLTPCDGERQIGCKTQNCGLPGMAPRWKVVRPVRADRAEATMRLCNHREDTRYGFVYALIQVDP